MPRNTSVIIVLLALNLSLLVALVAWTIDITVDGVTAVVWICVAYAISVVVCAPITAMMLRDKGYPVHYGYATLSLLGLYHVFTLPELEDEEDEDDLTETE